MMITPILSPVSTSSKRYPLVSVVIPAWNRPDELIDTAEDFRGQSMGDFELIIVDDKSPRSTQKIGERLVANDSRMHYYRLPEKGFVCGSMNEGIRRSLGRYIYIAHDHDRYLPDLLAKLTKLFEQNESIVYAFSGVELWNHDYSKHIATYRQSINSIVKGHQWKNRLLSHYHCPVPAQSMIRRSVLEQAGLYNPQYGASTDVEMWIRLCDFGDIGYVDEPLVRIRGRDINHHYAFNWTVIDEVMRIHKDYLRPSFFSQPSLRFYSQSDRVLLKTYLSAHKHRKHDAILEGRAYLRRHGVFLSKLIAYLI